MHERSVSPHPGYVFFASRSMVEEGVAEVERVVKAHPPGPTASYDPVQITLCAQAEALWRAPIAGQA
jgi:hypothetical protein